jgi:hypothetical protein
MPIALLVVALLSSACTTVRITATTRSSTEQRLLVRSLERAVARLDTAPLAARPVRIELFGLTGDRAFAEAFAQARLEERGVTVVRDAQPGAAVLRVFAEALAVDAAETLFGLPALQVPVLAVPIPEIALFKWERSHGHSHLQTYTYDETGRLLTRLSDARGAARYWRFTILIFLSFAVSDLDKPPEEPEPSATVPAGPARRQSR